MRRFLVFLAVVVAIPAASYAWRAIRRACGALAVALALAGCAPAEAKPPKPRAELIASPRVHLAPAEIRCTLLVRDPGKLIRCASEIQWEWSVDGNRLGYSRALPECDPYKLLEDVQTRWSETRTFRWTRKGTYMVGACMRGTFATACATQTVLLR